MRRIILMAMVLAVTVAGCNRFPDNGLQISANLLPDDSCFVDPAQEERLLRGLWDISYRTPGGETPDYGIALQLLSYLVNTSLEFQADQNNIQVDNYDIEILLPDGSKPDLGGLTNPYRVTTSAVIASTVPGGDAIPGVGFATGIPGDYQATLVALGVGEILLSIRAGGTTRGGFSQRSASFLWPVSLCAGCLNNCASDDLDTSCLPGQDVWPYCVL
ncbi:MAG: hypothetical protein HKN10_00250 [Myxococcales bacterium]|nr:hypothetical protein [Deltaproteobacteria bacterium]NNE16880.1 hypothetical protein [Myxococcales bacterium]